ncbi:MULTISPECIES: G-D-S-L family lipolytic protein [Chryseobacterium]|uniref:G-D-S-L family lipolytic protein n=1 Tax=Chryseobacterium TaxID=59732 RepID=UPI00195C7165|nr:MULTISPECIES: G-D-S-L family lipolytic protein [Chryseobacterium]MBM7418029.1 lysophospholipase L1-like esterase [Chryseobacterium sp. JUb44]MDH6212231.1 lysophospholipase L1-like esterase [Chryseobacterium sp. BIGb0186]WSO10846.1 G-D-S-L family lipolytic protein [Chryseobacterium scophthalmum]
MKKIIISTIAVSALFFTVSCNTDFDTDVEDIVVTKGEADFSKFISLGNSLTSGYRDGTLYSGGQAESFPSMIAGQMKLVGGGEFKQPLMPNNVGGFTNLPGFPGKLELKMVNGALSPVANAPEAALDNVAAGGPYQNMGVPGAKVAHLLAPGYGNAAGLSLGLANPYFVRFASSTTASVVGDALAQNPTFVSLWIGNNDVLGYATTGGDGTNPITPVDGAAGVGFNSTYTALINTVFPTGTTRKGVVANIPNVTSVPFFTRVPAMPLTNLTDTQVSQLNTAYATYNAGLAQAKSLGAINDAEYQKRLIKFTAGAVANGAVISDKDLTTVPGLPKYRQTTAKDYILLTASAVLTPQAGGGTSVPLEDKLVLTEAEAAKVLTATTAYNTTIRSLADSKGLAFVDMNAKMIELNSKSGISWNGVRYTATFVTGGTFSLDGVHLTGRGYAVVANEFIKSINKKYRSTLPQVDPNKYSGITFP